MPTPDAFDGDPILLLRQAVAMRKMPVSGFGAEMILDDLEIDPWQLQGKRVLDIASGSSDVVRVLRQSGVEAYGVDIAYADLPRLHESAEQFKAVMSPELKPKMSDLRNEIAAHPNRYVAGSALSLPVESDSIDQVISFGFFTSDPGAHLEFTARGVQEALRVLRPGGKFDAGILLPPDLSKEAKYIETSQKIGKNIRYVIKRATETGLAQEAELIELPHSPGAHRIHMVK